MTPLEQAQAHLAKAREFLEVAELSLDLELFNAATSDAAFVGSIARTPSASNSQDELGKPTITRWPLRNSELPVPLVPHWQAHLAVC